MKMKTLWIAVLLSLGMYATEFEQAEEDYRQGAYIKALNTFYVLAKEENPKAQYNLGLMYANGLGAQKDMAQAQQWYEKAAKQGNASAQYNLAQIYYGYGEKDTHAYEKAKYWYEKAVASGLKEAYNNLGMLYLKAKGVKKDEQKAFALFKKGAQKGDAIASLNVALLYAWGKKVPHDKLKAYDYLRVAAKNGKMVASTYLDRLCRESAWVCKK